MKSVTQRKVQHFVEQKAQASVNHALKVVNSSTMGFVRLIMGWFSVASS
jgi:hypothetical protein